MNRGLNIENAEQMFQLLEFDLVFNGVGFRILALPESSDFSKAADLIHHLGGLEEGLVAGGNSDSGEAASFEAAEDFVDLLAAKALALVFRQDAVVADGGQVRSLSGIVRGHADRLAVEASNKSASADGIGVVKSFAVGLAQICFEFVVEDRGVALGE